VVVVVVEEVDVVGATVVVVGARVVVDAGSVVVVGASVVVGATVVVVTSARMARVGEAEAGPVKATSRPDTATSPTARPVSLFRPDEPCDLNCRSVRSRPRCGRCRLLRSTRRAGLDEDDSESVSFWIL